MEYTIPFRVDIKLTNERHHCLGALQENLKRILQDDCNAQECLRINGKYPLLDRDKACVMVFERLSD